MMKLTLLIFVTCALSIATAASAAAPKSDLRAPAYPIITTSPYMNLWLMGDQFTEDWVRYWPGTVKAIFGQIAVDGNVFRWMGPQQKAIKGDISMIQQGIPHFTATKTSVSFRDPAARIQFDIEFLNPALVSKMSFEDMSRPVTYIRWKITSIDSQPHQLAVYIVRQ
jgi:hypothetical protein